MDPWQPDRRDAGRICPHTFRRYEPLSRAGGSRRRCPGNAQRHSSHRIRVRRAQWQGSAGINNKDGKAVEKVLKMTGGRGVDTAIEAVGVPASFVTCEDIVAPGGVIANVGVHGIKADLHLERLWDRNITITTRLVDTVTTPMLLKTVQSHKIAATKLITHRFKFGNILEAYETFGAAANTHALKVLIEF